MAEELRGEKASRLGAIGKWKLDHNGLLRLQSC